MDHVDNSDIFDAYAEGGIAAAIAKEYASRHPVSRQELAAAFAKIYLEQANVHKCHPEDLKAFFDQTKNEYIPETTIYMASIYGYRAAVVFEKVFDKLEQEPDPFKLGVIKPE